MTHQLVLIRHGQTEWARAGRHTGRTDVPLTSVGEQQARDLAPLVERYRGCPVLVSPLQRARRTAELAGLKDVDIDPDLAEWDYGGYEGLTTPEVRESAGPGWTVFADGVVPGDSPGESLGEVARRARAVLQRARRLMTESDVVLVGHGHHLRILASCWVDAAPGFGANLLLSPASLSVLGEQHDVPAIVSWNAAAQA